MDQGRKLEKYVDLYNKEQLTVLSIKPGITDYASLSYINENKILAESVNPEETYINEIMPLKLNLNLKYISEMGLKTDTIIIFNTILKISK